MAAVMVNFRIDEEVKKNMEQACKEMGMSMTAAFTVFATKVGKEKRIPFEITAAPAPAGPVQKTGDPVTAAQYDIRHHFCVAARPNQDYRFALHSASSSSFVFCSDICRLPDNNRYWLMLIYTVFG